ncbi:MAG: preprotein translocase subunit TatA [Dehalococcoides mccartyi]|uniref:twin-arginine translocase TatA/TatE family subunit n=1 Tax=Dehalococcoides mccartyi TaxID=61435 RepID=UPI0008058005|nr:twin-arginine translocase TatA/TatE family subunit [Dehalococcoides mccartyi]OBW62706.1 MAG: preprotein translocase subunit TatA [Dehalococcoides mccartyi]PKH45279.1 protein translocase TatA [Dehalococcoides mccartyi]
MPKIGPMEIIIIVLLVVVVFGVGKLPQVGDAIGKGIRNFRKASTGEDAKEEVETKEETKPAEKSE